MRARSLLIALAVAMPATAAAEFERRPYLQDARPDSVLLMWKNRGSSAATITVDGPGGPRTIPVKASVAPRVRVDGLAPATRYRYTVVLGADTATGELTTAPTPGAQVPVTFVVFGDNRSDAVAHYEIVERIRAEVPDFLLSTGDMVMDGGEERQWKQFFDIEGPLLADNVIYPALGNHDIEEGGHEWIEQLFNPPADRQAPGQYAFTYGPVRVIVLESNTPSFAMTDQTAWLERQLAQYQQDPRLRHLFIVMHHPVYSISSHGGLPSLREKWAPLFEHYGTSAVFSGHDHCYQRAEDNGVKYFVTGGGGAPLYGIGKRVSRIDASRVQRQEKVNHYVRVHVIGDLVELTAVRTDGTPIETVTWSGTKAPLSPELGGPGVPLVVAAEAPAPAVPVREDEAPVATTASAPPPGASAASPGAGNGASAPHVAAATAGKRALPPVAFLGLAGLALLGAAGLWRLTRPEPARVRSR
jgi:3',5'-cyclic AMP phosphodiesterase CpdA